MPIALVTGANGFIGSHLVRELLHRKYEVRGLVRHTSNLSSLTGVPLQLFLGDIRDPESLVAPMESVDYIFHLAALLMGTSKETFEETNSQGTRNMLITAEHHAGESLKRFLLVSSLAAAGPGVDPHPIDETRSAKPVSWYGNSKLSSEKAVRDYSDRMKVTIVRPSGVYGERERDISTTFPLVARRIQPILGLRPKHTVMIYVKDLVRGIVEAAESQASLGKTYFLNHPQVETSRSVVKTIGAAMGKPAGLAVPTPIFLLRIAAPFAELVHQFTRERPAITRDKVREVSQRFWVSDAAAAKADFGWEAKTDLLEGMRATTQAFFEEETKLRKMSLESTGSRWLKYVLVASGLGALIEITSALGEFYSFTPTWVVFLVIFGAFGFSLGTLAMLVRKRGDLTQFIVGSLPAGGVEALNELGRLPYAGWRFTPGWPLGLEGLPRSIVLGFAGGAFILIVNTIMRSLYKHRLRLG